jgi:ectoine hydroxylase-related dioxygenase (phytanoyl-CoA dioxygenase family)
VNDVERYLFDLRGYLVVKQFLTSTEVEVLNAAIDRRGIDELLESTPYVHTGFPPAEVARGNSDPRMGPVDVDRGLLMDWGQPFRDLTLHPKLTPYLEAILGATYRLDHGYAIFMSRGAGHGAPHHLHNGGTPFDPSQYYLVRDGRIHAGLIVVSVALSDCAPADGGFCCIPGSHKSSFALPEELAAITDATDPVAHIPVAAGDAIIFTEALTHGCIPWSAAHDRRTVLLKYCPGFMQWERESPMTDISVGWTEPQRRLLSPPFEGHRPPVHPT